MDAFVFVHRVTDQVRVFSSYERAAFGLLEYERESRDDPVLSAERLLEELRSGFTLWNGTPVVYDSPTGA